MQHRGFLSAFLAVAALLGACDGVEIHPVPDAPFACIDEPWQDASRNPQRFIAHGGGRIDGRSYTNSRQALEAAYRNGLVLFEFDLIKTRDGQLAAMHSWNAWREATGATGDKPTREEFKARRLFGQYDTLDLADLDRWFAEHENAFLVTDKVIDFELLVRGFRHVDRLIVEVFSVADFFRARRSGIRYPMLSLGAAIGRDGKEAVLSLLASEPVKFAAVSWKDRRRLGELLSGLRDHGVCVYVFTSSDPAVLEQHFKDRFYGSYTDAWDVRRGTCAAEPCETY